MLPAARHRALCQLGGGRGVRAPAGRLADGGPRRAGHPAATQHQPHRAACALAPGRPAAAHRGSVTPAPSAHRGAAEPARAGGAAGRAAGGGGARGVRDVRRGGGGARGGSMAGHGRRGRPGALPGATRSSDGGAYHANAPDAQPHACAAHACAAHRWRRWAGDSSAEGACGRSSSKTTTRLLRAEASCASIDAALCASFQLSCQPTNRGHFAASRIVRTMRTAPPPAGPSKCPKCHACSFVLRSHRSRTLAARSQDTPG